MRSTKAPPSPDKQVWRTAKPNGQEAKGRPVLIESETGEIAAGCGCSLNGRNVARASKKGMTAEERTEIEEIEWMASERKRRRAERRANMKPLTIDLTNPAKIDPAAVLQNRNRATAAAIGQMRTIALNPDYGRLGVSHDFGSGAPVVAFGTIPKRQLGKITEAIMADGKRYTVQYAVVDVDKVLTSSDSMGHANEEYFSDDPSKIRAIAGNGRLAGLAESYREGHADGYFDDMSDDPAHGVDQNVIDGMECPVLVRVMQPKDVSADISDRSKTSDAAPRAKMTEDAARMWNKHARELLSWLLENGPRPAVVGRKPGPRQL